jgi:peptide subunit release factor 1 (eRF1)
MHELQQALQRLEQQSSTSAPIVSLYLNLQPAIEERRTVGARLRNLLEPFQDLEAKLDHDGRMALRRATQKVLDMEAEVAKNTGHGVAVFVGGSNEIHEFLTLPRKAWDVAVAAPQPYLRPLAATLDQFHRVATLILDPRHSLIRVSHMGQCLDQAEIESDPIRKSDYGGWKGLDEHRVRQHAEEVHRRHYREVGERLRKLKETFELDVVFVGGREETIAAFLHELPNGLKSLVAETFIVDVNTETAGRIAKVTAELEQGFETKQELELVKQIIEANREGGLVTVGVDDTIRAANFDAIDLLLVAGSSMIPGWACRNCGWLALSGPDCSTCGSEAIAVDDIVDNLLIKVRRAGGRTEHIASTSDLDQYLLAARIRFPVPAVNEA